MRKYNKINNTHNHISFPQHPYLDSHSTALCLTFTIKKGIMPHSLITNTDTTNNTVYIYCCYGMTKYNTSKMECRFTTNFCKPHVPMFLLLLSNVYGLKEMKIAKCFSTVCMSHTATFHRELRGVYPVPSLLY